MKYDIKKGNKYLMDIEKSFPVEMTIDEMYTTSGLFGITYVFASGKRNKSDWTIRQSKSGFIRRIIKAL